MIGQFFLVLCEADTLYDRRFVFTQRGAVCWYTTCITLFIYGLLLLKQGTPATVLYFLLDEMRFFRGCRKLSRSAFRALCFYFFVKNNQIWAGYIPLHLCCGHLLALLLRVVLHTKHTAQRLQHLKGGASGSSLPCIL